MCLFLAREVFLEVLMWIGSAGSALEDEPGPGLAQSSEFLDPSVFLCQSLCLAGPSPAAGQKGSCGRRRNAGRAGE